MHGAGLGDLMKKDKKVGKYYYNVTELCENGSLFDFVQKLKGLNDNEARYFFAQILSAVEYCHNQGYVHRDLKMENFFLNTDMRVKLADFGNAKQVGSLDTKCGT